MASERALVVRETATRDGLELGAGGALGNELLDEHFGRRLFHEVDQLALVQAGELHELFHLLREVILFQLNNETKIY